MKILDGEKLAERILSNLKKEIKNRQLKLKLAVILVGDDFASEIFIKQKQKAAKKIGVGFQLFRFHKIKQGRLKKEVKKIAQDRSISGIIVQLPLPKDINSKKILNAVPSKKDVDMLSDLNFNNFSKGRLIILPPTVGAVSQLLENYKIKLKNRKIIIVGRGRLVGKPLSAWFKKQKSDFLMIEEKTRNKNYLIKKADILISGVGKPNLIKGNMIKNGVVIIDFGGGKLDNKVMGDIDFKSVSKKASYITPVPGGTGPLTVACLLDNLIKLNL